MSDLTWEHHDEYGDTLVITSTDGDAEVHVTGPDGWASVELSASALLRVALDANGITPGRIGRAILGRDNINAANTVTAILWPDDRSDQ